ncbi:MAG: hypothetical protein IJ728_01595 [Selenomonadaceae bacterium]|nr:hypothetical protein [Selenomonadaceae bacterium]
MSKNYDTENIIARYQEMPVSINQIAEEFNLCSVTISKILRNSNIKLWTRQDLNVGNLKVDFFKQIDTEAKAYLLGLFAADGCIYTANSGKLFSIQLQTEDAYMIEYVKAKLNAPRNIVVDKRDGSYSISVVNDGFVDNLAKYGVVTGKANRFLPDIADHLMHHYIRGLFDGDGSIIIRKSHSYGQAMRYCVVLLAHSKLIVQLQNYLERRLDLSHLSLNNDGSTAHSIRYSRQKDIIAIINYMYSNAHLYLLRKFQKCKQAISYLS